jgi:5'-3' exonuclease
MGVPGFFAWLLRNFKNKILQKKLGKKMDYLYIDANCLFHPECMKIKEYCSNDTIDKMESKMFRRIINYLNYIEKYVDPQIMMIISVDGVAPLAKMGQQRKRRYKTIDDTEIRNKIKIKHKIEINDKWNNTVITPGTEFMERLHVFLKKYYKSKNSKIKYTYSSYHTPGEGEHKILQHIKNTTDINDNIVIYGLDADLIFLAISCGYKNTYLLRESLHFGNKYDKKTEKLYDPVEDVEQELIYVSIKETRNAFNSEIWNIIDNRRDIKFHIDESIDFTDDLVIICFLLGNDFLPHFPSLDMYKGGLDTIIDAYIECFIFFKGIMLCNKRKKIQINTIFLMMIFEKLGKKEERFFKVILPEFTERNYRKRCFAKTDYEKDLWELDNMKIFDLTDPIKLGVGSKEEWKFRYYEYYFHISEHQEEFIEELVKLYLEGIMWVSNYYFDKCKNWKWQYPYDHAPFISDIYEYLKKNDIDINDIKFDNILPVSPMIQLATVLPPACNMLLPINYRKYIIEKSILTDLFPIKTELDMLYKDLFWQCTPKLPVLDIDRIDFALSKVKLTELEKIRNSLETDYVF